MKHGKRYAEVAKKVDRTKLYEPEEAIALAKETAAAKFDETVEIHIRTSCDGRHADQQIRGAVVLPAGIGKKVRVLVFAQVSARRSEFWYSPRALSSTRHRKQALIS